MVAVNPPPVDLERRGEMWVVALVVLALEQRVETLHRAAGAVGVVVDLRCPELVGAEHEPCRPDRLGPREPERVTGHEHRRPQEAQPLVAVVGDPRHGLELAHAVWVKRTVRRAHAPRYPL